MAASEGAENSEEELTSSDFDSSTDSSSNHELGNEEEFPLQQDVHQQNLVRIHMTDQMKKKEGELHGLRYMIVSDSELADWHKGQGGDADEEDERDEKARKRQKVIYQISNRHKMVMFPLKDYPSNDTHSMIAFVAAAAFIFVLIIVIPIFQQIVSLLNLILSLLAAVCVTIGCVVDGKFYLMFNYETKQIYLQQRMCYGCCICGNKGMRGIRLGSFDQFLNVNKFQIHDVFGETTWERWQFLIVMKDPELENGENCQILFTSTNEENMDALEYNVNQWWKDWNDSAERKV
eukprot:CAMPEP_0197030644 /NCGR_PEP_ID=MMETSP1384-20130603/9837_1 /TAXON_ID=29189 /ORGANISM="Ammonia sp." /LENGTH=290 /DNA_ID=CAMNT_0042460031 /DNA_START=17 /DNA_END=889 /DNA_ORIENTATION=+